MENKGRKRKRNKVKEKETQKITKQTKMKRK